MPVIDKDLKPLIGVLLCMIAILQTYPLVIEQSHCLKYVAAIHSPNT